MCSLHKTIKHSSWILCFLYYFIDYCIGRCYNRIIDRMVYFPAREKEDIYNEKQ